MYSGSFGIPDSSMVDQEEMTCDEGVPGPKETQDQNLDFLQEL
jgi:hypothetical protein